MGKKKDSAWVSKKLKDLRKRKRAECGSISSGNYGQDVSGKRLDNKLIKKIKEGFKVERRAIKRAEKQTWKEEVKEAIKKRKI